MSLTFHRAFDMVRNPLLALSQLIDLGIDRVLTSGLSTSAEAGAELLRQLVSTAAGRLSIMPGGGVNPANARHIIDTTGAHEIHASARSKVESGMRWRGGQAKMGSPEADEYSLMTTNADIVRQIREAVGRRGFRSDEATERELPLTSPTFA